jgi:hypothetical protein
MITHSMSDRDISKLSEEDQKRLARALFEKWDAETKQMRENSSKIDWTNANVNPKDIGVRFGPVMTPEMFEEYKARKGKVNVITSDQLKNIKK